ncbi:MAG: bifunctional phosphoribosyl-AMP cyclohydrolase/phosphoribosyl-ATP diphosphatase HisIE [Thermoflexales bacterium]
MLELRYDANGLIPAVVQDALTGRVLMLGWMNAESLQRTQASGEVWFWSRSRGELWHKGETSGNVLRVRELRADCDADCLLIRAEPAGPTCHTGRVSCFWHDLDGEALPPPHGSLLDYLSDVIAQRRHADPSHSYTARLFGEGRARIAQKVGEEGVEVALAGVAQDADRLVAESADLLFMLLVLLEEHGVPFRAVLEELLRRHQAKSRAADSVAVAQQ